MSETRRQPVLFSRSKSTWFTLLVVLCLAANASCAGFWWEKARQQTLKAKTFKNVVGKDKYVLVDFYTKACPYCEDLYPIVNRIMDELAISRKDIIFAKLDGEESPSISEMYGIEGYPNLRLFKPGDSKYPENYPYEHKYNALKGYLMTLPPLNKEVVKSNEAELKIIANLRQRVKELERIESSKENMTSVELRDIIASHDRSINRSIKSFKRNLANFKKIEFRPSLASTPREKESIPAANLAHEEEAPVDDSDVDFGYQHAWLVKLLCFVGIGGVFGLIFERNRAINNARRKNNID